MTCDARIQTGRDAVTDAEESASENEGAAAKEERPGMDDACSDTLAASALIPPSLNIWVPPVDTRIARVKPMIRAPISRLPKLM